MDADWGDAGSTIESSTDCSTDGHRSDSAWSIIQPRVVHDVEQNDIATALTVRHMHEQINTLKRALCEKQEHLVSTTAQLMRTQEAARKLLVRNDPSLCAGGAAGKLLRAQQLVLQLQHDKQRLELRLAACKRQLKDVTVYVKQRDARQATRARHPSGTSTPLLPGASANVMEVHHRHADADMVAQMAAELEQQRALVHSLQRALDDAHVPSLMVDSAEALTCAVQKLALGRKGGPVMHQVLSALQKQNAVLLQELVSTRAALVQALKTQN